MLPRVVGHRGGVCTCNICSFRSRRECFATQETTNVKKTDGEKKLQWSASFTLFFCEDTTVYDKTLMHGLSSYIWCLKIARISVLRNKLFANIPQYVIASCTHMTNISLPLKPPFHIHYFASHMSAWLSICLGFCPFFFPFSVRLSPLLSLAKPLNALTCSEFRFSRAFSRPLPRVCKVEPFFFLFFFPLHLHPPSSSTGVMHTNDFDDVVVKLLLFQHKWSFISFWWIWKATSLHGKIKSLRLSGMNPFPLFVCMCRCCACLQSFPHHECGSAVSGRALRGCQWVLPKPTQRHPQRRNLLRLSRLVITASVSACPCVSSFLLGI